uniref:Chitin-binding type-2 domain-containing protein n=1 Tax=Clastoptera arizonana TaxID=38151 RepID=A0A1B6E2B6_9HEMI
MKWLKLVLPLFFNTILGDGETNADTDDEVNSELESWPKCDPDYLEGYYTVPHPDFCDRYFTCQNTIAYLMQCQDGFGYVPILGCRLLHRVDCTSRPKLRK